MCSVRGNDLFQWLVLNLQLWFCSWLFSSICSHWVFKFMFNELLDVIMRLFSESLDWYTFTIDNENASKIPSNICVSWKNLILRIYKQDECFGPLTSILENIGKVTSYCFANSLISASVPGSCPPNWFEGNAMTLRPLSQYCLSTLDKNV